MILKEEAQKIIKDYDLIEIYNKAYDYELMKLAVSIPELTDVIGWDYEEIINLCLNIYDVYMYQLGHVEKDYSIEFKLFLEEYPELEIASHSETGYIQEYASRTANKFVELYKKYTQE